MLRNDLEDSSYHISICSPHGIEWVSHQIGKPGFGATARRLSRDIQRNERLEKLFDPTRSREPDMETALSLIAGISIYNRRGVSRTSSWADQSRHSIL